MAPTVSYDQVLDTHRRLFSSVYPWAGQDRATLAPHIAIAKGGVADLFSHPADVSRANDYALGMGLDGVIALLHRGIEGVHVDVDDLALPLLRFGCHVRDWVRRGQHGRRLPALGGAAHRLPFRLPCNPA